MGRSSDDDGGRIPLAERSTEQVRREYDTSNLDADLGRQLGELRIGSRELFLQATEQTRMAIVVVDPHGDDQPIAYVNRAFIEMTGYSREEAIGRNCRFLQGPDTDPDAVRDIREALAEERVAVVQLLNYHKNGTPFWNSLHIGPVYDADGKLAYFYGSQWDVTNRVEAQNRADAQQRAAAELQHRVHNLFAVISAIVRISARGEDNTERLSNRIIERIQALSRAHRATIGTGAVEMPETGLRTLVEAVLEPYRDAAHHSVTLSGENIALPARMVTPVGVAIHELATNALKYGALGLNDGAVDIAWRMQDDRLLLEWRETKSGEAQAKPTPAPGGGSGSRIVEGVLKSLGGEIATEISPDGYRASISVPLVLDSEPA